MRVFIGVTLPERVRDNLARSVSELSPFASGSFIPKTNYHITLHFLGEISDDKLIFVQSAMDSIKEYTAPTLSVNRLTVLRGSNIVCAKILHDEKLLALHEKLATELDKYGFTTEHRAYRPHVSLIRNASFNIPFSEAVKNATVYNKPFCATEITLYQSTLTPNGAIYNPLYTIKLDEPKE